MPNTSNFTRDYLTMQAASVLLLLIVGVEAVQYWLKLPLEGFASPQDILGVILGILLFLCTFAATARAPGGSWNRRILGGLTGFILPLVVAETICDGGPLDYLDLLFSILWLFTG